MRIIQVEYFQPGCVGVESGACAGCIGVESNASANMSDPHLAGMRIILIYDTPGMRTGCGPSADALSWSHRHGDGPRVERTS